MSCKTCDPLNKHNKPDEVVLMNRHNYGQGRDLSSVGKNMTCPHCGQKYHVHQPFPIN